MRSRFEDLQDGLLASVREGLTVEDAASRAGVSVNTVRGWAREGRKRPDGRFGVFAAGLGEARARSRCVDSSAAMGWDEFEGLLAGAVRSGSVTAMKLFAELHGKDREAGEQPSDALTRLDELAAARQRRSA